MVEILPSDKEKANQKAVKSAAVWGIGSFLCLFWAASGLPDAMLGFTLMLGFGTIAFVKYRSVRDQEYKAAEKLAKKEADAKLRRQKDAERISEEKVRKQREAEEWAAGAPEREAKAKAEAEQQRLEDEEIEHIVTARRARIDQLKAHLDADLA